MTERGVVPCRERAPPHLPHTVAQGTLNSTAVAQRGGVDDCSTVEKGSGRQGGVDDCSTVEKGSGRQGGERVERGFRHARTHRHAGPLATTCTSCAS